MGVGDVFEVRVFGEAELSGIYRVASDGTISFPLIGKVQTVGLTVTELTDIITERLRDGFLKYPQVSIFVKEYNSKKIFVFGEVQKPGTFSYEEDMTIIQAITVAGGFTKTASKNKVSVTRLEEAIEKRVFLSVEEIGRGKEKNFFLLPGDIVFVPESIF
jgi:polysaccharide export outer membrane protein